MLAIILIQRGNVHYASVAPFSLTSCLILLFADSCYLYFLFKRWSMALLMASCTCPVPFSTSSS
jgi:hypothetical protein